MSMIIHFLILIFSCLSAASSYTASEEIEIVQLDEGVHVYRSHALYEGNRVAANGMIVESSDEVILIDTPWDEQQTVQLLEWIGMELNKPVSYAIITHAHADRIGGIDVLKSRAIPAISSQLTAQEAARRNYSQPDITFESDTLLSYGNVSLEIYYPGPGHTTDNSVVYLKNHHMLFGGCFIKSASSPTLGNIEDATLEDWPRSLRKVMERYPKREMVIPGHGGWEAGAIENTLDLLSKVDLAGG